MSENDNTATITGLERMLASVRQEVPVELDFLAAQTLQWVAMHVG